MSFQLGFGIANVLHPVSLGHVDPERYKSVQGRDAAQIAGENSKQTVRCFCALGEHNFGAFGR